MQTKKQGQCAEEKPRRRKRTSWYQTRFDWSQLGYIQVSGPVEGKSQSNNKS